MQNRPIRKPHKLIIEKENFEFTFRYSDHSDPNYITHGGTVSINSTETKKCYFIVLKNPKENNEYNFIKFKEKEYAMHEKDKNALLFIAFSCPVNGILSLPSYLKCYVLEQGPHTVINSTTKPTTFTENNLLYDQEFMLFGVKISQQKLDEQKISDSINSNKQESNEAIENKSEENLTDTVVTSIQDESKNVTSIQADSKKRKHEKITSSSISVEKNKESNKKTKVSTEFICKSYSELTKRINDIRKLNVTAGRKLEKLRYLFAENRSYVDFGHLDFLRNCLEDTYHFKLNNHIDLSEILQIVLETINESNFRRLSQKSKTFNFPLAISSFFKGIGKIVTIFDVGSKKIPNFHEQCKSVDFELIENKIKFIIKNINFLHMKKDEFVPGMIFSGLGMLVSTNCIKSLTLDEQKTLTQFLSIKKDTPNEMKVFMISGLSQLLDAGYFTAFYDAKKIRNIIEDVILENQISFDLSMKIKILQSISILNRKNLLTELSKTTMLELLSHIEIPKRTPNNIIAKLIGALTKLAQQNFLKSLHGKENDIFSLLLNKRITFSKAQEIQLFINVGQLIKRNLGFKAQAENKYLVEELASWISKLPYIQTEYIASILEILNYYKQADLISNEKFKLISDRCTRSDSIYTTDKVLFSTASDKSRSKQSSNHAPLTLEESQSVVSKNQPRLK